MSPCPDFFRASAASIRRSQSVRSREGSRNKKFRKILDCDSNSRTNKKSLIFFFFPSNSSNSSSSVWVVSNESFIYSSVHYLPRNPFSGMWREPEPIPAVVGWLLTFCQTVTTYRANQSHSHPYLWSIQSPSKVIYKFFGKNPENPEERLQTSASSGSGSCNFFL